jgi:hypothetical protein
MNNKCVNCSEKCPQAELAHNAALGRMYAMKELVPLLEKIESGELAPVVHGRWAALDDDCEELEGEDEAMRWGCSACREIVEYDDWTHRSRLTRFCPNCAAKMDGDVNGTL